MKKLQLQVSLGVVSLSLLISAVSPLPYFKDKREALDNMNMDKSVKYCHKSMPCAWAVYVPFTRTIDHFIYNTCQCRKNQECLNTEDDLSVSAYVYMCRIPTPADKEKDNQQK